MYWNRVDMIGKVKLLLLYMVFMATDIPVCWSDSRYPEALRPFIDQDRSSLAASTSGDTSKVFYIYVFDRLVPVPNRYVLKVKELGRHVLESMAGDTIGRELLIGTIETGVIVDGKELGFHRKKNEYEILYEDYQGMGLDVYVYKPSGEAPPIQRILVSNGREYLVISDQNSELWRDMFKAARTYP